MLSGEEPVRFRHRRIGAAALGEWHLMVLRRWWQASETGKAYGCGRILKRGFSPVSDSEFSISTCGALRLSAEFV